MNALVHTIQRYRTLRTSRISALPIAILMPHSACNCRCVMCDIWKGNHRLKQLAPADVAGLMSSLEKLGTRQVLMSGGEALLNPHFFELCSILREADIKIVLLSTGLTLGKHAGQVLSWVDEVIVSLDGDEPLHDSIRNIPGAFRKLSDSIARLHELRPGYRVTARTVIHRLNFRAWASIVDAAHEIGLGQISFLPADVTSEAFNRTEPWDEPRQHEILPAREDLPELQAVLEGLLHSHAADFESGYIAESTDKIRKIGAYYSAAYGLNPYPFKKCNAPWVSAVVEADGTVRPCFFHAPHGNIHQGSLDSILNSPDAIRFRKHLDMEADATCSRCVCYLNLSPRNRL